MTGKEFKAKNQEAFSNILSRLKDDFTDSSEAANKKAVKTILIYSVTQFNHIKRRSSIIEEVIPNIIWMYLHNIVDIEDAWFNDSDEDQWIILNTNFAGAEKLKVLIDAYSIAVRLLDLFHMNDYFDDNYDFNLSKKDLITLLK